MNRRLDRYLCKKYPVLFSNRNASPQDTALCWGFQCGSGWYKIIKEAAEKLEPLVAKAKQDDPQGWQYGYYRASTAKEKYGTLRLYISGGTEEMYKIADGVTRQSETVCEMCGRPGKLRGNGWFYTACVKHTRKEDR